MASQCAVINEKGLIIQPCASTSTSQSVFFSFLNRCSYIKLQKTSNLEGAGIPCSHKWIAAFSQHAELAGHALEVCHLLQPRCIGRWPSGSTWGNGFGAHHFWSLFGFFRFVFLFCGFEVFICFHELAVLLWVWFRHCQTSNKNLCTWPMASEMTRRRAWSGPGSGKRAGSRASSDWDKEESLWWLQSSRSSGVLQFS